MEGKQSLRRLGIRDAQEPSGATDADSSEGCIVEMCFWRGTIDLAEPKALIECGLLLYYEGIKRRSEGEERLVSEQGDERAKQTHFLEAGTGGDRTPAEGSGSTL